MSKNLSVTGTEQEVCNDIAARQRLGIEKYGTTVASNPLSLREWLQHAYEEALDLSIYLKRAISEADETQRNPTLAADDLLAIGKACEIRSHETILQSVLRVVRENNRRERRIASARLLLKTCRDNSDGMKLDAYDDLQEAINILEHRPLL